MKKNLILFVLICWFITVPGFSDRRDQWQQPQKVMDAIGVRKGMNIGVAGAGRGYFTFKMAPRVGPEGRIYANEIESYLVDQIESRCRSKGITNVTAILGEVEDPLFPRGQMDMVFMCYVFHDLAKPVVFLKNITKSLKSGASVVLLEQDPGKTGDHHFFTQKVLKEKVKAAGYKVSRIITFLKRDNIYILQPNNYRYGS